MERILKFITKQTGGLCYSSYRYCHEKLDLPQIDYDDGKELVSEDILAETDKPKSKTIDLTIRVKHTAGAPPIFKYFLDGSRRTYKVDDIEFNGSVYPLVAGQICVSCCVRESSSQFRVTTSPIVSRVLSLPSVANVNNDKEQIFFKNLCKNLNKALNHPVFSKFPLTALLPYAPSKKSSQEEEKYENRAIAKIQDLMIEHEKELVKNLASQKKHEDGYCYLLKDGSIQYKKPEGNSAVTAIVKDNYRRVIGASKMFNPEILSAQPNKKKGIASAKSIAELPLFSRTLAYRYHSDRIGADTEFAIWYVRIRGMERTDSPFAGILKLEKILVTKAEQTDGIPTDEINDITSHIITERTPVCYGLDKRWANHLYPVYLTESYIKSQFLSDQFFINLF